MKIDEFINEDDNVYEDEMRLFIDQEIENPHVRCSPQGNEILEYHMSRGRKALQIIEIMNEALKQIAEGGKETFYITSNCGPDETKEMIIEGHYGAKLALKHCEEILK